MSLLQRTDEMRPNALGGRGSGSLHRSQGRPDRSAKGDYPFWIARDGGPPAGSDRANSGHHHLLIDTELPPLDQPIPNDFNHLHFGAGQTEAEVTLKPGTHTLQLLLGDKDHIPHNPPVMSPRISVVVTGDAELRKKRPRRDLRVVRRLRVRESATVTPGDLALTEGFRSPSRPRIPLTLLARADEVIE